jgi:hypothetical protein
MRRLLLVAMLLTCSPVSAGWLQMSSQDANSVTYADPDTVKIDGQRRQIMELHDFKAPDKTRGNRSTKVWSEYDCERGRIRILQEEYFSGQMGEGKRLGGYKGPSDWIPIAPNTRGATLLKFVCSRPAADTSTQASSPILIDINQAKADELMTLKGIGEARAAAIIKGRPYARKDELMQKKIIPESVYNDIKDKIIAKQ